MRAPIATPWLEAGSFRRAGTLSALIVVLVGAPLHAAPAPPAKAPAPGLTRGLENVGLPGYQMPAQYSVDLVMTHEGKSVTMKRAIDGGRMRSEISAEGAQMIMLERPEDNGAVYNIMPSEKMIMKMTPSTMMPAEAKEAAAKHVEAQKPAKVEKLGIEKLEGRPAAKFRVTADGHSALAWFDEATGAPMRMESEGSVIEWKNLKPGPQPAKLFELPAGYELMDMDEKMKEMKKMTAGMPGGGAALGAMSGMGGMGGGMSGMAGNFGAQMGSNMGQSIGSGIGATFGGPLGAMAGGYIGGSVGGWLGRKTADAVTPGPPSR